MDIRNFIENIPDKKPRATKLQHAQTVLPASSIISGKERAPENYRKPGSSMAETPPLKRRRRSISTQRSWRSGEQTEEKFATPVAAVKADSSVLLTD
jgi:hypothetical protein